MELANAYVNNLMEHPYRLVVEINTDTTIPRLRNYLLKKIDEITKTVNSPSFEPDYHDVLSKEDIMIYSVLGAKRIKRVHEIAPTQEGALLGAAIAKLINVVYPDKTPEDVIKLLAEGVDEINQFKEEEREQYRVDSIPPTAEAIQVQGDEYEGESPPPPILMRRSLSQY